MQTHLHDQSHDQRLQPQEPSLPSRKNPLLLLLSLLVWCAVLLSSFGNIFAEKAPALALTLNPFNMDARVNLVTSELNAKKDQAPLEELRRTASLANVFSPADARGFSLIGEIEERLGNGETAQRYYDQALKLSQTEIHALRKKFIAHLRNNDAESAIETLDFILRRWPGESPQLVPYVPAILAQEEGLNKAAELFSLNTDLRTTVLGELYKREEYLPAAEALIVRMRDATGIDLSTETLRIIQEYFFKGQAQKAFRLYQFTQSEAQRAESGYVNNGRFLLDPAGHQFDWSLRKQSGVTVEFVTLKTSNTGKPVERVLQFLFRDSPVSLLNAFQNTLLPTGNYQMEIEISARGLETPKPVLIHMECPQETQPYPQLFKLPMPTGTYDKQTLQVRFSIDSQSCPLQRIFFYNETYVGSSWKFRYNGELNIHKISITRTEQS